MDELTLEGKKYLSSKRAAKITGYAKDYVGQLCREGRVTARLVGRSWYVLEDSIREHRFGKENNTNNTDELVTGGPDLVHIEEQEEPKIRYTAETAVPIQTMAPKRSFISSEIEHLKQKEESIKHEMQGVSSMQDIWHEWFSVTPSKKDEVAESKLTSTEKKVRHTGKANDFNLNLDDESIETSQVPIVSLTKDRATDVGARSVEQQEVINHPPLSEVEEHRFAQAMHNQAIYTSPQKPSNAQPDNLEQYRHATNVSSYKTVVNTALVCIAIIVGSFSIASFLSANQNHVNTGTLWTYINYLGGVRAFANK